MLDSLINASSLPIMDHRSVIKGPKSPTKSETSIKSSSDTTEPLDYKLDVTPKPDPPTLKTRIDTTRLQEVQENSSTSCYPQPDQAHASSGREIKNPHVHVAPASPAEPADLSNKKPENVTCVPEIDFMKEEINDAASECSNSSDPDRLEVDMSQVQIIILFENIYF